MHWLGEALLGMGHEVVFVTPPDLQTATENDIVSGIQPDAESKKYEEPASRNGSADTARAQQRDPDRQNALTAMLRKRPTSLPVITCKELYKNPEQVDIVHSQRPFDVLPHWIAVHSIGHLEPQCPPDTQPEIIRSHSGRHYPHNVSRLYNVFPAASLAKQWSAPSDTIILSGIVPDAYTFRADHSGYLLFTGCAHASQNRTPAIIPARSPVHHQQASSFRPMQHQSSQGQESSHIPSSAKASSDTQARHKNNPAADAAFALQPEYTPQPSEIATQPPCIQTTHAAGTQSFHQNKLAELRLAIQLAAEADLPLVVTADIYPVPQWAHCKHVTFTGPITAARYTQLLAGAKALIYPAITADWTAIPVMQALVSGTPVLCTATGVLPEFIHEGVTGFTFHSMAEARHRLKQLDAISPFDCRLHVLARHTHRHMAEACLSLYMQAYHSRYKQQRNAQLRAPHP